MVDVTHLFALAVLVLVFVARGDNRSDEVEESSDELDGFEIG